MTDPIEAGDVASGARSQLIEIEIGIVRQRDRDALNKD